jgi:hypothetical protein
MRNGAAVEIRPVLTNLTGPMMWSFTPASSGTLNTANPAVATFSPSGEGTADKVSITATVGGVSQSIQLDVKPSPPLVPYLDLPAVWTISFGEPNHLTGARPVASAADKSGNLYLAYTAPVSEIKKVGTDGSITTYAHVSNPGSLAFGSNGVLYVVDRVGSSAYAIRRMTRQRGRSMVPRA